MKKSMQSYRSLLVLELLAALAAAGSGCATNGRHVLLKEYGSSVPLPTDPPLKGMTICIKGFQTATNLTSLEPKSKPEQPSQFTFVKFTSEQSKTWDQEFRALKKKTKKTDWWQVGNVRNGFGMVMSHVYALNDPGPWLAETLKLDLEAQGAKVVDAAQADSADLCLSGTIQFCRVDIYMKIWGDLVVDLELQPKNRGPSRAALHTEGGTTAWMSASSEFYKPLREARQKLSWLTTREIVKALKQPATAATQ